MAILLAETAVLAALLSAIMPLFFLRRPHLQSRVSFLLLGISGLAASWGGGTALLSRSTEQIVLPIGLPWLHVILCLDPLAGFFLFIVGLITLVVACYGHGYIGEYIREKLGIGTLTLFTGLFVAGMFLVLLAADAFSFMFSWELMSVASYFLVVFQHEHAENRRAAFLYLLMAVLGGACLFLAFGVLAGFSDGFGFAALKTADPGATWATIAFTLAFVGFGLKAGIIPLHVWLPLAHPVAPSHISALMSGVMLKVAVYGFIRFVYDLLGEVIWQWGVIVLLVGSASAVLGVLYALMQHDLKRLLAYHSVENIGIIYIGLGLSMIFYATDHVEIAALALIAALYHCLNHALFKSLLFLGAGAILQQSRQHDMEMMGGLIKKMPVTALCFLIGCISISALPPFNGFVSEWLTFQAALQGTILKSGILGAMIPVAAAMLALTGALATACFVKVYGIVFLGQPRSPEISEARESSFGMRVSQLILAVCCLGFGIFPTWAVHALNTIPEGLMGAGLSSVTGDSLLWLTPINPQTASYGAPAVLLGILFCWLAVFAFVHPPNQDNRIRIAPAWDCGFGPLNSRMQYTASAFAMPIRRIFSFIWLIIEKIEPAVPGKSPRYILKVDDRLWLMLYVPIGKFMLKLAERDLAYPGRESSRLSLLLLLHLIVSPLGDRMTGWFWVIVKTFIVVLASPLMAGWVKWLKCRLQNRQGPPPWQPYRDLLRLSRKQVVLADTASPIFRMAPYIVFSVTIIAVSVIPVITVELPVAALADVIALVGFLALGRFFLSLAGMDVGTAFGGMGSSREVTISSLAEPALLMAFFTLAMNVSSTNLSTVISHLVQQNFTLYPSLIFSSMGLILVAIAETGRIPIDNPATHLELTMIHEAMILEYSGRHLALMEWASMLKLSLYSLLIVNLIVPWGIALTLVPADLAFATLVVTCKLLVWGLILAVSETIQAKMRLFRAPQYLGLAFILTLLGMMSHIILEVQ